jgi:hypothetical protein
VGALTAHLSPREWTAVPVDPALYKLSVNLGHSVESDRILRLQVASRTRFHTNNIHSPTSHRNNRVPFEACLAIT